MKLTVLGGGGVRSPFLAKSLTNKAKELGITKIVFMDNDAEKLKIYGGIAKRVADAIDSNIEFELTTDAEYAVTDAKYIITTLRVGQDEGRYQDEKMAQKYGILGQETTGIGGFAMSLRSIPILIEYCKLINEKGTPDAVIFNFTNPSGLVTQALRNEGFENVYGICDGPSHFTHQLAELLEVENSRFDVTCYGLNHLSFFREAKIDGKDVTNDIINHKKLFTETEMRLFDRQLLHILHDELPNEYLYFFYYSDKVVESIRTHGSARGALIKDINQRMLNEIKKTDLNNIDKVFKIYMTHLMEREKSYFAIESGEVRPEEFPVPTFEEYINTPDDGGYSSIALNFIKAFGGNGDISMTLMVPNKGSIKELNDDDVIEITCDISKGKVEQRKISEIPDAQMQIIRTIKMFERLTVESIKEKNKEKAIKALMVHPLINTYNIANQVLEEFLVMYKNYIGEWK
ncbi:MAG: glycoside hydrolase [Sebaldella sp.]|nr:glycoside hydrolase [Sebaldella sp.]